MSPEFIRIFISKERGYVTQPLFVWRNFVCLLVRNHLYAVFHFSEIPISVN